MGDPSHWKPVARKGLHCTGQPNGRTREATREKVQGLRRELDRLHYKAKSKELAVGGGVSMWPAMDDMRLSREDAWVLVAACVGLTLSAIAGFFMYHGNVPH